jgi:hypothetical protein
LEKNLQRSDTKQVTNNFIYDQLQEIFR